MGLDQYITIRHKSTNNAYAKWEKYWKLKDSERIGIRQPKEPSGALIIGYFRKHNNVHNWFVENVQKGVDDCGRYRISVDDLQNLKQICENIMSHVTKTKRPPKYSTDIHGEQYEVWQYDEYTITDEGMEYVKEHFPSRSGFFFGNTNYNDDYFWTVENTIEVIKRVIDITNENFFPLYTDRTTGEYTGDWVLEYSSSW